jgi:hypothetical protein
MKSQAGTNNTNILAGLLVAIAVVVGVVAVIRLDTTGEKGNGLGKEFIYDVKDLVKIDPNLILCEETVQPISTGFNSTLAIAIGPDGRIYVAGDEAIRVFDEDANSNFSFFGEIELTFAPRCLTVADDGKFYIGSKDHLEVYDGRGKHLATWQSLGDDAVLTSIAVYKNDVFVADAGTGNGIVLHYDTTGRLINRIGKKDKDRNIPGFNIPSPYFDVAVASDGLLRVANTGLMSIEAYTFEGDLEFSWGRASVKLEDFTPCCNPVNFAMLGDDSFVTCEKGLTRVKIYDADGAFVGVVAGTEQLVEGGTARICYFPALCQKGGFDVAVDADGRVFVLDTIKNVVRIFTRLKEGK